MRECQSGSVIIGLPVRVTPNQEMNHLYVKKDKMADGAPRTLFVSHPRLNPADFCGEGTGHFRSSGDRFRSRFETNRNLLRGVIGPKSTRINTVFDDVASLLASHADVLWGLSRVPAPRTSAESSG